MYHDMCVYYMWKPSRDKEVKIIKLYLGHLLEARDTRKEAATV